MESADIIADAESSRNRGRGNLGSDSHPGLFPTAEDEFGFRLCVQNSSLP